MRKIKLYLYNYLKKKFKKIIRLIQIFGGNFYFCSLNFENIKIILYIYIYKVQKHEDYPPTIIRIDTIIVGIDTTIVGGKDTPIFHIMVSFK